MKISEGVSGDRDRHICQGSGEDQGMHRVEIGQERRRWLTTNLEAEVFGFCYLEPRRHIPDLAALEGAGAATFGGVLGRLCRALQERWHHLLVNQEGGVATR